MMTRNEFLSYFRQACEADGGCVPWAKKRGISFTYACAVLRGEQSPGPKILDPLEVEKVIGYRFKDGKP